MVLTAAGQLCGRVSNNPRAFMDDQFVTVDTWWLKHQCSHSLEGVEAGWALIVSMSQKKRHDISCAYNRNYTVTLYQCICGSHFEIEKETL